LGINFIDKESDHVTEGAVTGDARNTFEPYRPIGLSLLYGYVKVA